MADHLRPDELDRIARGDASADALQRADRHLHACEVCQHQLAGLLPLATGTLAAIRHEAHRHLTVDELESCVDAGEEQALDALAAKHLETCDTCRRELSDLRAFEALPARAQSAPSPRRAPSLPQRLSAGATLWFRTAAFVGALAAVLLAIVVPRIGLFRATESQLVVHLPSESEGQAPRRPRALRPESSVSVATDVSLQIGRAQLAANQTGRPQTLELRVSSAEYAALLDALDAVGTLDPGPEGRRPVGASGKTIKVSVTFIPSGARGTNSTSPQNAR